MERKYSGSITSLRDEHIRDWLAKKHAQTSHQSRHDDSLLLKELKSTQRIDQKGYGNKQFRKNLIAAGTDSITSEKLVSCDGSVLSCRKTVDTLYFEHGNNLSPVRSVLHNYDKGGRYSTGLSANTILTEYRRKLMFHAMLNTGEVDVSREDAVKMLGLEQWVVDNENSQISSTIAESSHDWQKFGSEDEEKSDDSSSRSMEAATPVVRSQQHFKLKRNQPQAFWPLYDHYDVMKDRWKGIKPNLDPKKTKDFS